MSNVVDVVQLTTQAKEKFVEEEAKILAPLEQVCCYG